MAAMTSVRPDKCCRLVIDNTQRLPVPMQQLPVVPELLYFRTCYTGCGTDANMHC